MRGGMAKLHRVPESAVVPRGETLEMGDPFWLI